MENWGLHPKNIINIVNSHVLCVQQKRGLIHNGHQQFSKWITHVVDVPMKMILIDSLLWWLNLQTTVYNTQIISTVYQENTTIKSCT